MLWYIQHWVIKLGLTVKLVVTPQSTVVWYRKVVIAIGYSANTADSSGSNLPLAT